jgi:hypothetical protein
MLGKIAKPGARLCPFTVRFEITGSNAHNLGIEAG